MTRDDEESAFHQFVAKYPGYAYGYVGLRAFLTLVRYALYATVALWVGILIYSFMKSAFS